MDLVEQHPTTEHTRSSDLTIALVVHLAQVHIILMTCSIPFIMCVPNGCMFPPGNLRMISDGFKANSALSTALWGSGLAWVTAARYLGVATSPLFYAAISHLCVPLATYSAFLTLRYDMQENYHVLFAGVWIASSFTFHFCVIVRGVGSRSALAFYIAGLGATCGVVFLALFITVLSGNEGNIDTIKNNAQISSVQLLSAVSVLEVITVFCLMYLDFLQCGHVIDNYLLGESAFLMVSNIEFTIYRIPIKLGVLGFYLILTVFIGGCVAKSIS